MLFNYTARDMQGNIKKGEIEATNENEVAEYLNQTGLLLTGLRAVTEEHKPSTHKFFLESLHRIKGVDKIFFTQNLQVMLKAGLTMTVALQTLAIQTTNKRFKKILEETKIHVEKGEALSDALAKYPKIFPEIFVNMIRAGEKSGKLEEVLLQLTSQLRKSYTLVNKIRSAMTYPIIVVSAMIVIGIIMIIFVIPQITSLFREVSAQLPLPTRVLIATSDFISTQGHWVAIGLVILISIFLYYIKTPSGKKIWHKFLLKLPVFGKIFTQINLAKFSRTFSSLLKTDIPVVQAFQITSSTVGNVWYRQALLTAAEDIKTGKSISQALGVQTKLFPALVIQMSAVGEETGTLDNVLSDLAEFYEGEVDRIMGNLSTVIEPLLMLLLGIAVGFFAVSIIMPMYSLAQQM